MTVPLGTDPFDSPGFMSKVRLPSALGTTCDVGSAGPSATWAPTVVTLYLALFLMLAAPSVEAQHGGQQASRREYE